MRHQRQQHHRTRRSSYASTDHPATRGRAWPAPVTLSLVMLALALSGACTNEETVTIGSEPLPLPTAEMLADDSTYMQRLFAERGQGKPFINLDPGDDRQFRFIIHRLLHAGKTPANSPRLFERLRQTRARHRASFAQHAASYHGAATDDAVTSSAAGGGGNRCGNFAIAPGSVQGTTFTLDASALMSCDGPVDYIYADVFVSETDEDQTYLQLLSYTIAEDFGVTDVRTNYTHGSAPADGTVSIIAESFAMGIDDVTGDEEYLYTVVKTESNGPPSIHASAVGTFKGSGFVDKNNHAPGVCELDHPRDATGDGIIRLCYKRTFTQGTGDCDYAAVNSAGVPGVSPFTHIAMMEQDASGAWVASATERWEIEGGPLASVQNLLLPIQGMVDAGSDVNSGRQCKIMRFDPDNTWAALTLLQTGGWCAGQPSPTNTDQLFDSLQNNRLAMGNPVANVFEVPFGVDISVTPEVDNTLLMDFGIDCLQNLQDANLILNITMKTNGAGCWDDAQERTRTATCELIFDVRNSCFAAGTGIRRADGTIVPVEDIEVGDLVVSNSDGLPLTVTALTRGVEPDPMVRLVDDLGHELLLTAKHPVVTDMGLVPAEQVLPQSRVETEQGMATIVKVERVPYDGQVYNLSLGTPDEISMLAAEDITMFADGIRVVDNEVQFDLEQRSVRESASRDLAPAWTEDQTHAETRQEFEALKQAIKAGLLELSRP